MTKLTLRAVTKYGEAACRKAYEMNCQGYGARSIALEGPATITSTQAADAAINAGRELANRALGCFFSPADKRSK